MKLGLAEEAEDCETQSGHGERERAVLVHGGSGVLRALDGPGEGVFSLRSSSSWRT